MLAAQRGVGVWVGAADGIVAGVYGRLSALRGGDGAVVAGGMKEGGGRYVRRASAANATDMRYNRLARPAH
jgi:hypothetical protein